MAVLVENWIPPSRENWGWVIWVFSMYPLLTLFMWFIDSPMGKTSPNSRLNWPGKLAWVIMEIPGPLCLLAIMFTLPSSLGIDSLPWENWVLAGVYLTHYIYRALLYPSLQPSISPIHPLVSSFAIAFNVLNGTSLAGWLFGYGPISSQDWNPSASSGLYYVSGARIELGLILWALGFAGTIFHDDELREIRRAAARKQVQLQSPNSNSASSSNHQNGNSTKSKNKAEKEEKVYLLPQNGLFRYILYPHYVCEWLEWVGFWIAAGGGCVPARNFLICEVAVMLPRAVSGRGWYVRKFGREKVGGRRAVIPGVL